jgi:hypothetical protein
MRPHIISLIVALFLAAGTAHAKDVDLCLGPNATEIPCSQLGNEFMCGKSDIDTVYMRTDHLLSDLSAHTITVQTPLRQSRNGKRYPVIRYDFETGKLTLNGKQCRLICRGECE